jgi:hypothetical protein
MSGIPSWAVPGAKVVCIKAPMSRYSTCADRSEPVFGGKYTIDCDGVLYRRGVFYIGLSEMHPDSMFRLRLFRPIISKSQEQDVAMFKSLLHTAPNKLENIG